MVEGSGLENRRGFTPTVGSNPTPSARNERLAGPLLDSPRSCRIEPRGARFTLFGRSAVIGAGRSAGRDGRTGVILQNLCRAGIARRGIGLVCHQVKSGLAAWSHSADQRERPRAH